MPGQPVPASAIRQLTALAGRVVTENGGKPTAWADAVVTTQAKALAFADMGSSPIDEDAVVYLVTLKGHFVCDLCSVPPGGHAPTGTYVSLVYVAKTFRGTAFGLRNSPPPSLARLGPVTYLPVR